MKSRHEMMQEFWNKKARENAMYYVSSFREYGDENPEEFWKWGRILAERFVEESKIVFDGTGRMLEIGCGLGRMTPWFADHFAHVHALDVSSEMVEQARARFANLSNVTFEVGNGLDLSGHEDGSLDFVFSYIVLQHIPDAKIALGYVREAGRILRSGGHAHLQFSNLPRHSGLGLKTRARGLMRGMRTILGGARKESDGPRDLDHPAWVGSRLELKAVRDTCDDAGLELIRLRGEGTQYCWLTARKV